MTSKPYLIFSLNDALYAIETFVVQEIFFLPELTPVAEAPREIVGVVNLRGEFLPVMDLSLRFGYRPHEYQITDSIIVLVWQGIRMGLIVSQVSEVENIRTTELSFGREIPGKPKVASLASKTLVTGIAEVNSRIVVVLNHETLFELAESVDSLVEDTSSNREEVLDNQEEPRLKTQPVFCPHATAEERDIFRQRAANLRQQTETEDLRGLLPVAVIGLNGEYFGLDLKLVREFTDIHDTTPVPCCPPHIVGNMNLRGEIMTLIDLRGLLNLPLKLASSDQKAMIIQIDDIVAGVTVEEVFDVAYVNPMEMATLPVAVHSLNEDFLQGTAPYHDKVISILDMAKILNQGNLIVEEEV
ncbi:MAG: chemotaxis protein CheW [Chroococcales cyanobacterium]